MPNETGVLAGDILWFACTPVALEAGSGGSLAGKAGRFVAKAEGCSSVLCAELRRESLSGWGEKVDAIVEAAGEGEDLRTTFPVATKNWFQAASLPPSCWYLVRAKVEICWPASVPRVK